MSGSSDDLHLACKDDFIPTRWEEDLELTRDTLLALGAIDAAGQTDAVLCTLRQARDLVGLRIAVLCDVWMAVERVRTGDWAPEDIKKALADYHDR